MASQLPDEPRLVYVGNLAWSVKWQDLKDHMKKAGEVEFCKVLTQDGGDWGRSRGVGYVRYATEEEAQRAVATMNETELMGRPIKAEAWTGGKPREGGKGYGKGAWMPMAFAKGYGKGYGRQTKMHGDSSQMVFVGNLPFKLSWQDLKDHFKAAGNVEFVKILTEDGTEHGRSKGMACLRFTEAAEAAQAVATLNGTELMGRAITVDKWSGKDSSA